MSCAKTAGVGSSSLIYITLMNGLEYGTTKQTYYNNLYKIHTNKEVVVDVVQPAGVYFNYTSWQPHARAFFSLLDEIPPF